jgi:hypothetical protein
MKGCAWSAREPVSLFLGLGDPSRLSFRLPTSSFHTPLTPLLALSQDNGQEMILTTMSTALYFAALKDEAKVRARPLWTRRRRAAGGGADSFPLPPTPLPPLS